MSAISNVIRPDLSDSAPLQEAANAALQVLRQLRRPALSDSVPLQEAGHLDAQVRAL
jgi:hypothetical protein